MKIIKPLFIIILCLTCFVAPASAFKIFGIEVWGKTDLDSNNDGVIDSTKLPVVETTTITADLGGATTGHTLTLTGDGIVSTSRSGDTVTIKGTEVDSFIKNLYNPGTILYSVDDNNPVAKTTAEMESIFAIDDIVSLSGMPRGSINFGTVFTGTTFGDNKTLKEILQQIETTIETLPGGHDAVTIGTANGLSITGQTLSLAAATNTTPGAMTAAQVQAVEANTARVIPVVDDTAYDPTSWDGNTDGASKNSIRDKIESLPAGHNPITLSTPASTNLLSLTTQEVGIKPQAANKVFAGPEIGLDAMPSFRPLTPSDIPPLPYLTTEVDGSIWNEIEVQNEVFNATNYKLDEAAAVSQANFYTMWHGIDTNDDGKIDLGGIDSTLWATKQDANINLADLADGSLSASKVAGVADADYGDVTVSFGSWVVEDDSHMHGDSTISDTITVGPLGSVNDAAIPATITRDTEWDSCAKINAATTDGDFVIVGGAYHNGFSDYVKNEHIDWTVPQTTVKIDGGNYDDNQTASEVSVITTGFTGKLSAADDTVQKVVDTLDDSPGPTVEKDLVATSPITINGGTNIDNILFGTDEDIILSVAAATESSAGITELATAAETTTGTDATRAVTPDSLAGSNYGKKVVSIIIIDDSTVVTTGDGKFTYHVVPILNGWNLVDVSVGLTTASTSGTPTVSLFNVTTAQHMLSTSITVNEAEYHSGTSYIPPVINTSYDDVATGDRIRIDVDVAGTGAKGLQIDMVFQAP